MTAQVLEALKIERHTIIISKLKPADQVRALDAVNQSLPILRKTGSLTPEEVVELNLKTREYFTLRHDLYLDNFRSELIRQNKY
jgi:hypothetical protein